jgi:putative ABC transport system substrate-binding protein
VRTVFVAVADPVGGGFADSLARPGGNASGFMAYEFSIAGSAALRSAAPRP